MYEYKAKVIDIIDGDTIRAEIDLGFNITRTEVLRLYGINTPEIRSKDTNERDKALRAKNRLVELCAEIDYIRTFKDKREKYGRILAELYDKNGNSLNQILINEGFAVEYFG